MEKKVSLRLSDESLEEVDSFIARHEFKNRSEFMREAALDYIKRHRGPKTPKDIPERIRLPKKLKNNILYLIHMDHYNDWQDAIHELVREGLLQEDIDELKRQYDSLDQTSNQVESFKQMVKEEEEYMKR